MIEHAARFTHLGAVEELVLGQLAGEAYGRGDVVAYIVFVQEGARATRRGGVEQVEVVNVRQANQSRVWEFVCKPSDRLADVSALADIVDIKNNGIGICCYFDVFKSAPEILQAGVIG